MELWVPTALILALSAPVTGASEEVAIDRAIRTCNRKLGTNFDFKIADVPPKQIQSGGFVIKSAQRRPAHRLARLFPWLRQSSRQQFILTTTWKKSLRETTTARSGRGDTSDTVTRSCSAYLTNQESGKYVLTCNNVSQEGKAEEKSVEVPLMSSAMEGSGTDQDEEIEEDGTWDLSRCLGCIFDLLGRKG